MGLSDSSEVFKGPLDLPGPVTGLPGPVLDLPGPVSGLPEPVQSLTGLVSGLPGLFIGPRQALRP